MSNHIILYGKGGVGKSTLAANISAALAEASFSVMQIGCDPKGESCSMLYGGVRIPSVLDRLREQDVISADDVVRIGFKGISCVELGDPSNSDSCVASEITRAFDQLTGIGLLEDVAADFVIYDVSTDSSCAGFHAPLLQGPDRSVFVVTTADYMSLHTANSIFRRLERYGQSHAQVSFAGIIPNGIASSFEESFVQDFAEHTRTRTLGRVPRSLIVRQCELYGKTVIEAAPLSNQSYYYRRLANQIVDSCQLPSARNQPLPLQSEQLREWAREWGDRIYALENGLVNDGAAI